MSLYYDGNLDEDLKELRESYERIPSEELDRIAKDIGYGRAQQILQIMWAKHLRDLDLPTNGALYRGD